jgi:alpha-mannosidase
MEKNPEYKYFNFDGQTIMVDDYLEIQPQNRDRLQNLINTGRITIGPLYCQPSPILQTAEGLVRNFLRGRTTCQVFQTEPLDVGYIPDQFLHTAQFPQILKGFGINNAAFSRGMANQYDEIPGLNTEFEWEALDGSKVTAFHLMHGYGQNANLSLDPVNALNQMAFEHGKLMEAPWSSNMMLAFAGSDHCGAEEVLLEAIDLWNDEEELVEEQGKLKLATWPEYLHDFHIIKPQLKTVKGEIMGRRYTISLHGVYSSFIPLKIKNYAIHDLLERWSEPFFTFAAMMGLPLSPNFIQEAWKWLLQNQPHDSSWTSSCSQVMEEMQTRFAWAEQNADEVFRRSAQWIVQHLKPAEDPKTVKIVVFNPHPWSRTGIIRARLAEKDDAVNYQLVDERGIEVTHQVYEIDPAGNDQDRDRRRIYVPSHGGLGRNFKEIIFTANDIPPLGYKAFFYQKRNPEKDIFEPPGEGALDGNDQYLENDAIRTIIDKDGTISITQMNEEPEPPAQLKSLSEIANLPNLDGTILTKVLFKGLHQFEDISDVGDGWEFLPLKGDKDQILIPKKVTKNLILANDSFGTLKIDYIFEVPESIAPDGQTRSSKMVELPVTVYMSMHNGENRIVEFRTEILNTAKYHRLRLRFPTGLKTDHINVNTHFGVHARSVDLPKGEKWAHPPENIAPFQKFLSIWDENKKQGLTLLTKGIPIYEPLKNSDGTIDIGLTLYRSIGEWGNHINIKPPMKVPSGQLLNSKLIFEYALIIQKQPWDQGDYPVYKIAEEFNTPLRWEEDYNTFRYNIKSSDQILPWSDSFFEIRGAGIMYSALKPAEDKSGDLILRIFNYKHNQSEYEIIFKHIPQSVKSCDLKEDLIENALHYSFNEGILKGNINGAQILSFRLRM